jgi:hypothetical protein
VAFGYGWSNGKPVAGDWNSDGSDPIGLFNTGDGHFHPRNENTNGFAQIVFALSDPGDHPIAGYWDGSIP